MRPKRFRRELLYWWLCIGGLGASACRLGYEELPLPIDGGMSGAASGGVTSHGGGGGTTNAAGQDANETAGAQGLAGASSLAGQSTGGVNGVGGEGAAGVTGDAGAAGVAGDGGAAGAPNTPGCVTTADCACAADQTHSYWFCTQLVTAALAEAHCETQGMQLVRVDSSSENDFLLATGMQRGVFANNAYALIGANDVALDGDWRWRDDTLFWQGGPAGAAVGGLFSKWTASSPSTNGVQHCAGILGVGTWQDRSCTAAEPFICESL